MEKNKDITELDVYRDALLFSNLIWKICLSWNYFEQKTIGIQLVRAADSISANIAEGFGRFSFKENINFCYYARGSFYETCDWLRKASTRRLLADKNEKSINKFVKIFPKRLNGYINYLKKCSASQTNKPINQ